jgi:hypothetical protein
MLHSTEFSHSVKTCIISPQILNTNVTPLKKFPSGNSLGSYSYHKLAKMSYFYFIFYLFSSTKLENRRAEQVLGEKCWHQ